MRHPTCIHAPLLLAGQASPVLWGEVEGAEGYRVERKLHPVSGSIPEEWFGLTWQKIRPKLCSFGQIHAAKNSWRQVAKLGGKRPVEGYDSFALVYIGPGESTDYVHTGMGWRQIRAAAITMAGIGVKALSWRQIATMGNSRSHRQCMDTVPMEAESAVYRVQAYGGGVESEYRYSPPFPVQHFTAANDALAVEAEQASPLLIGVGADLARRFPLGLTVSYDHTILDFLGMEGEAVALTAQESGRISLHFTGEYPDKMYSGDIALLCFEPLAVGETTLLLGGETSD